jgi:carbonic anhydrase
VIKVAGNVADTDEIGSAEYGVDHLGTPVLMVLGHSYCGAVTAVTTGAEVHGSIPALVDTIVPAVEKARHDHPDAETPELIVQAIEANIWQAIEDLLGNSHAIADRAKDGRVIVVGAVYDILTGKVSILGAHPNQTELLGGVTPPVHAEPALHAEPAKDAHAPAEPASTEQADAAHAEPTVEKAAAEGHAEAADAPSSGGFGFFSFIVFVLLLIGAVFILDKKILNPDQD